jgi:AcrR family transcriptional regulator
MMTLVSELPEAIPDAAASAPPSVEHRAIEATLACIARHGLSKTTIDDVARQAGFSRATLYRYFGGKRDLVERMIRFESDRITADLRAAADAEATLEDAVHAMFVTAGRELARHEALRFVAAFEPELLLPHLTFSGGNVFLRDASDAVAPALERFLGERSPRAAEWIARMGLGLWMSPTAPVSFTDEAGLHEYVHELVVPAIRPTELDLTVREPTVPEPTVP